MTGNAITNRTGDNDQMIPELAIPKDVSEGELLRLLKKLPNGKAPGPDGIPNEALKTVCPEISQRLAEAISRQLTAGTLPNSLKESTTVVLRKKQKKDYSLPGSYRPIALENSLTKLVEKIVADRMANAAEEHKLLLWNQMDARKHRSTITTIDLLTTCVQTA